MTIGQVLKKNVDEFNNSEDAIRESIYTLLKETQSKLIELSKKGITQYIVENCNSFIQLYHKNPKVFTKTFLEENLYFDMFQGYASYDNSAYDSFTIHWDKDNLTEEDCNIVIMR